MRRVTPSAPVGVPAWLRLLMRLVPARWRDSVVRDLIEERRASPRFFGRLWVAGHLMAIAAQLHVRAVRARLTWDGLGTGAARDLRASGRRLLRAPVTSLAVVLTIAMAVAGVGVVSSVLRHTVLSPLPFPDAGGLVAVHQIDTRAPETLRFVARGNFVDLRREARSFATLVAGRNSSHTFTAYEDGDTPLTREITYGWFETLGVAPALGRTFTAEEVVPNGPDVAILSDSVWRRRYGADPGVVGRTVELDGRPHTIVGVMPDWFHNPVFGLIEVPSAWVPLRLTDGGGDRGLTNLLVAGRLAPGRTMADAGAEAARVFQDLAERFPDTNRQSSATVVPMAETIVAPVRTPVLITFAAVLAVFLAACGNVASVMLARALAREQEFALQQAIGARRLRVVMQVIGEHLLLALPAAAIAAGLAALAGPLILALVPQGLLAPRFAFEMDAGALGVVAAGAATAALLAAVPALLVVVRAPCAGVLGAGASRAIGSAARRRWAAGLVAAEVAVAAVLIVGAGLVGAGFSRLTSQPPGFDPNRALTFRVSTRGAAYADAAVRERFYERLVEEFAAIPGVRVAGAMAALPVFPQFNERAVYRADRPAPERGREPRASVMPMSPGSVDALGLAIIDGRSIDDRDRRDAPPVVLLSRSAARRLFDGERAVGASIVLPAPRMDVRAEVVGLVEDTRSALDATTFASTIYQPMAQAPAPPSMGFVLRTEGEPMTFVEAARAAVRRVDRHMPLYQARPMTEVLAQIDGQGRFAASLLGAFALLGLLLVLGGIYGTLSHLVAERRREMGVRLALGASRASVLGLVVRAGLRPALGGLTAGLAAAFGFGRLAAASVTGTPAFDAALFTIVPVVLTAVVVIASLLPALRAARVQPVAALRVE